MKNQIAHDILISLGYEECISRISWLYQDYVKNVKSPTQVEKDWHKLGLRLKKHGFKEGRECFYRTKNTRKNFTQVLNKGTMELGHIAFNVVTVS